MKFIGRLRLSSGLIFLLICGVTSYAQDVNEHSHDQSMVSPYAGEQTRAIRTLSAEDIRELQDGGGWGLAKAAELNGLPGPAHLLEMVDRGEIHLSADQLSRIHSLYQEMKDRAIPVGLELIEQERHLNERFAAGDITEDELQRLVTQIGETTAELRYIHLSTHLETYPVLNPHQIAVYNRIRGYFAADPESGHSGG